MRANSQRILLVLRFILGGILIYASMDKIHHPAAFAEAVYNYKILPDYLINFTAMVLPWLELVIGLSLVLGLWLPGASLLSSLLLATFFVAILFNAARGLDVHCGCFSTSNSTTHGAPMGWYLIRDGLFLVLAVYLCFHVLWGNRRLFERPSGSRGIR